MAIQMMMNVMVILPYHPGAPTTVEIDIEVRSMGQISEMDMVSDMYVM